MSENSNDYELNAEPLNIQPPLTSPVEVNQECEQPGKNILEKEISEINTSLENLSDKLFSEIREIHKVCQNFIAGSLRDAEAELDQYHEIDRGRAFDDVLSSIAEIYIDYEDLPDSIEDENLRKRVNYILLDILQVLESYGVKKQKSIDGEERNLRLTKVIDYVETDNFDLHGKIAASRRTGFGRANNALVKELVSIYKKGSN